MRTSRILPLSLALGGALALTGCTSSQQAAQEANEAAGQAVAECPWDVDESISGTVCIAFQVLPSGDRIVKDQRILENCMPNVTIEWTQYSSGGDVVQGLGSNCIDIGTIGSSPSVIAMTEPLNLNVRVVWIQDIIGDAETLAVKDTSLSSEADLEGTTISVPSSSTAHFSLLAALEDAGLDPTSDVTLVNLSPEATLSAWQSDEIDAAYVWDPTLAEISSDGKVLLTSSDVSEMGSPTFDFSMATTTFVKENPAFMETWTRAQDWAVNLIHEDPAAAAESMSVEMGSEVSTVEAQLEGTIYVSATDQRADYFAGDLPTVLASTSDFLTEQSEIDAARSAEDFQDYLYVEAITAVAE